MKKLLMMLFCLFTISCADAQVKQVSKNKMPKNVVNYVEANYSDREPYYQIEYVNYNFNRIEDYEVLFDNGTKLEFCKNGELKSIDCGRHDHIELYLLPEEIAQYIDKVFTGFYVLEYDIEFNWNKPYRYEVELTNGITLRFNKKYKLVDVE